MSDAPKTDKKPGSKKGMFIGIGGLVVVLAGGGYWYMAKSEAAKVAAKAAGAEGEEEEEEAPKEEGERGLIALEPFVVNLADEGGSHFLRTDIQLIIKSTEEEAKEIQEKKVEIMPIRSAVLELLAQQSAATLVTPEGKEALKAAIKKRAGEVFHKHKIKEVLFSEFVVQF
jgi:flagellar FliL protein